jgi:hypothetical protein
MTDIKHDIKVAMETDNHRDLIKILDECNGSYAVKYVLGALLKKDNEHTLQSLLVLIDQPNVPLEQKAEQTAIESYRCAFGRV